MIERPVLSCRALLGVASVVLTVALGKAAHGQVNEEERIVGRVVDINGQPIGHALLTATRAPDRLSLRTRTDSTGGFSFLFRPGTGDYLVSVNALGYRPYRKRILGKFPDQASRLDVVLQRAAVQLDVIRVEAPLPKPQRGPELTTEIGALEHLDEGVPSAVNPGEENDINAIAATTPGVLPTQGGASVFGLSPATNSTTLNGLLFSGNRIPQEARFRTRVSTSTYDPARGGFSGAQIALELAPGNQFSFSHGHFSFDSPWLQQSVWSQAPRLNETSAVRAGVGSSGELIAQKFYYNFAADVSYRRRDGASWTSATPEALSLLGISPDSVMQLRQIAESRQIPLFADSRHIPQIAQTAGIIARLDHTPFSKRSVGLLFFGRISSDRFRVSNAILGSSAAALAIEKEVAIQINHSAYIGARLLNELKAGFSADFGNTDTNARLPSIVVAINSPWENGQSSLVNLSLGGSNVRAEDRRGASAELKNETQISFNTLGVHRVKGTMSINGSTRRRTVAFNPWGTFRYLSLSDFRNESPISFSRGLPSSDQLNWVWDANASVGDYWRPVPRLQLLYGIRADSRINAIRLPAESKLERITGRYSMFMPASISFSPRLGFTWLYGNVKSATPAMLVGAAGTQYRPPRGVLRGGLGLFRGAVPLKDLEDVLASRSSVGANIACSGESTPIPDWNAYLGNDEEIPSRCRLDQQSQANGVTQTATVLDHNYQPPTSLRGNLGLATGIGRLAIGIDAAFSLSTNQNTVIDANLISTSAFTISNEADRPVFIPAESILPSGFIPIERSRQERGFDHVNLLVSDKQVKSRQVTVSLRPQFGTSNLLLLASYTLASSRQRGRGFDGTTAGDPRQQEWAPSMLDIRHHFVIQAGYTLRNGLSVTAFGRFFSGFPFAPLVSADINADGYANDRAYVFRSDQLRDSTSQQTMEFLLKSSESGRLCLSTQINAIALPGSCRGPWSYVVNGRIELPWGTLSPTNRLRFSASISNVLGFIDRIAHGDDARGWGSTRVADPVLYHVTGFNLQTRQFRYSVNPRFGRAESLQLGSGQPFQITVTGSFNLGSPVPAQQLKKWLRPGRAGNSGKRLTATEIAERYSRTVPNIYEEIINESDSLLLTPSQTSRLQDAELPYREKVAKIWQNLGDELAALPEHFESGHALRLVESATKSVWDLARQEKITLRAILSATQIDLLDSTFRDLLADKRDRR